MRGIQTVFGTRPTMLLLAGLVAATAGCSRGPALPEGETQFDRSRIGQKLDPDRQTIADLFNNGDNPNTTVEVNRYIWNAAQDVLDFLPIEAADPFTGVLVYGYGTPPGGGRAYRATVYVRDPALDARSLNVAIATRSGPASPETVHAIEDAILTRARELRVRDSNL